MTRPDPVPITVAMTERLNLRTTRVTFATDLDLSTPRPASHLSLWFSDPTHGLTERDQQRQPKRTFTPRFVDGSNQTMTVDFVLHGSGPASTWASSAQAGDVIWAGPIRGGFDPPADPAFLVLIGDDTAIPAIGTIVEAVDPRVGTRVILEVVDEHDERQVSPQRQVDPIWIHRGEDPGRTGQATLNLVREIEVPEDAYWWIAGEREAIRAVRDVLVRDRGVDRTRYNLNAHWRLTSTDPRLRT